jgi:predicted permease
MALSHLRYALRLLRLQPASSAAIVLTLALAIGANTTLFTLINAALIAPLPVSEPDRLVNIYSSRPDGAGFGGLSYPDFLDLRDGAQAVEGVLGYSGLMATITDSDRSEVIFGELVTANYFSLLGVEPVLGRGFQPLEGETPGAHPVVVISHRMWQRRFNADGSVVGRALPLNGRPFTIVGVAPEGFSGLLFRGVSADLWAPVSMMGALRTDQLSNRDERWMFVKGRLRRDASVEQASAEAQVIAARLQSQYPASNHGRALRVLSSSSVVVHPDGDRAVLAAASAVMAAAGLVLVVACANLAGVMLARGLARQREIAIRLAIGARRGDIMLQWVVESALLASLGGVGGLILGRLMAAALASWRPDLPVPVSLNTAADLRVTLFTFGVTAAALVLFSFIPARRASRLPAAGSRAATGFRQRRRWFGLRDGVLVPQLAIAVTLVAAAGLLVRSLTKADTVSPGFDLDRTAFIALNLSMNGYDAARSKRFYEDLARRLKDDGGVTAAAVTNRLPLDLYGNQSTTIAVGDVRTSVQAASVGHEYFEALAIRLERGRAFTTDDEVSGAEPVVIVSAAAARQFWRDADAVGATVRIDSDTRSGDQRLARVVGVAADVKVQTLAESPQPFIYRPLTSGHGSLLRMVVRSSGSPDRAVGALRNAVSAIDPAVGVFEARTMAENLDVMIYPYRLAAGLGGAFGILALLLAAVGLYGVLGCGVSERLRELAIRLALGAPARSIVRSAAAETGRAVAAGLILGAAMAAATGSLMADVLFGVSPFDAIAMCGSAAVLAAVVAGASAGPLRRAMRAEPAQLLRQ